MPVLQREGSSALIGLKRSRPHSRVLANDSMITAADGGAVPYLSAGPLLNNAPSRQTRRRKMDTGRLAFDSSAIG